MYRGGAGGAPGQNRLRATTWHHNDWCFCCTRGMKAVPRDPAVQAGVLPTGPQAVPMTALSDSSKRVLGLTPCCASGLESSGCEDMR